MISTTRLNPAIQELVDQYFAEGTNGFVKDTIRPKLLREIRYNEFLNKVLPILMNKYGSEIKYNEKMCNYTFVDKTVGKIIYFPKSDRINICAKNVWQYKGLNYLNENIDSRIIRTEWIDVQEFLNSVNPSNNE